MKAILILACAILALGCQHDTEQPDVILADVLAAGHWTVTAGEQTWTGDQPVGETLEIPDGVHELTLQGSETNSACITVYVLGGRMLATDTCHVGEQPVTVRW